MPDEYRYSLTVIGETRFALSSSETECAVIDIRPSSLALERQRANAAFSRNASPSPAGASVKGKWKSFLEQTGLRLAERLLDEEEEENNVSFSDHSLCAVAYGIC